MNRETLKEEAWKLRSLGFSYAEICHTLKTEIPKGTLSGWFKGRVLNQAAKSKIRQHTLKYLVKARTQSVAIKWQTREQYLARLKNHNSLLAARLDDPDVAKIALAMLYLGEGFKSKNMAGLGFGNSDPKVISLFLKLLRQSYPIDETKFRCTVQCRADQDAAQLEAFWSQVTGIPTDKFYAARVDLRTLGQPSRKPEYKGVCRINYFSAHIFHDIMSSIEILTMGL